MLQEITPSTFDNRFTPERTARGDSQVFLFTGEQLWAALDDQSLRLPRQRDLPDDVVLRYLFAIDEEAFFLIEGEPALSLAAPFALLSLRGLLKSEVQPKHLLFAAYTALHLAHWYADHRFCGRCGSRNAHAKEERALLCPSCGHCMYPRIAPAVIVAVTNGKRLLLTRYQNRPDLGYVLIAGFTEIGETLEETVAREVKEEVGLVVTGIRYFASQPWGLSGDILAGFFCLVAGDPTPRPDGRELKEAVWMERADIPEPNEDFSLTSAMMRAFKAGFCP